MKKIILFAAIALAGCDITINSSDKSNDGTKLPTDGKTFDVKAFKSIHAVGVFNIVLLQGKTQSVVAKGILPKDLKIWNSADTLKIADTALTHNQVNFHVHLKTDIYITVTDLTSMTSESVGSTKSNDTLHFTNFSFSSEGVGETKLLLSVDTVNIRQEGVGALGLYGVANYATITDNGVGALDADAFKVEILHVDVSGVGAAHVYASKEIYIQSSGVGGLKYYGPAKVMQNESSGIGGVKHID